MENSMASNPSEAVETFELTKREATLLVHIGEHFPTGFAAEDLAVSLGWSVEEVHGTLQVRAVHGLIEAPPDAEVPAGAPLEGSPLVGLDDLLTPEEQDAARESKVPNCNGGWLALGEELAVLRALGAGKETGFTEAEAAEALEWASMARLGSLILDLVFDGHLGLLGPDGDGEMKFVALDAEGKRVTGRHESASLSCSCPPLPDVTTPPTE